MLRRVLAFVNDDETPVESEVTPAVTEEQPDTSWLESSIHEEWPEDPPTGSTYGGSVGNTVYFEYDTEVGGYPVYYEKEGPGATAEVNTEGGFSVDVGVQVTHGEVTLGDDANHLGVGVGVGFGFTGGYNEHLNPDGSVLHSASLGIKAVDLNATWTTQPGTQEETGEAPEDPLLD